MILISAAKHYSYTVISVTLNVAMILISAQKLQLYSYISEIKCYNDADISGVRCYIDIDMSFLKFYDTDIRNLT